jgi:hypothetical protein
MKKLSRTLPLILVCGFTLLSGCVTREVVVRDDGSVPPPPPPAEEIRPFRPYPTAEWVPGHYEWRHHRWVWMHGHWR